MSANATAAPVDGWYGSLLGLILGAGNVMHVAVRDMQIMGLYRYRSCSSPTGLRQNGLGCIAVLLHEPADEMRKLEKSGACPWN